MLCAFNKPFLVLSQFTPDGSKNRTLSEFQFPKGVYAIGRLDADSEGLLLLSDEPALTEDLLNPKRRHPRVYWAQVEGCPNETALRTMRDGVVIQGRRTGPCKARLLPDAVDVPPRDPPIRFRKNVPASWVELELVEGKNRQVRRMTAAVGYPTLRLIRKAIGRFELGALAAGEWRLVSEDERRLIFSRRR